MLNIKLPLLNTSASIGKSEGIGNNTDDPNFAVGKFLLKQYSNVCMYVKNTLGSMWRTLKSGESYDPLYATKISNLLEDSSLARGALVLRRRSTKCTKKRLKKRKL
jgi:hypothetical protein